MKNKKKKYKISIRLPSGPSDKFIIPYLLDSKKQRRVVKKQLKKNNG